MIAGAQPAPPTPPAPPTVTPAGGPQIAGEYTLLPDELPADFDYSFNLKAALGAPSESDKLVPKALVNYQGPKDHYTVQFGSNAVGVYRVRGGKAKKLAVWSLPPNAGDLECCIKRRGETMTVICGQWMLGAVTDGDLKGGKLGYGPTKSADRFADARLQLIAPIYLADDFMRQSSERGAWEPLNGNWRTVVVGDPRLGANPFSYAAVSPTPAVATTGYWFWDDYAFSASVKPAVGAMAGLAFYCKDKDNYLVFRWTTAARQLVAVVGGKETVLAERPGGFAPNQWYRLAVRIDGDRVQATIDDFPALDARCRLFGQGPVGLYTQSATETFFDNVEVKSGETAHEALLSNQVTNQFSKEASMANWATQRAEWLPAPAPNADLYWNRGLYYGSCEATEKLTGLGSATLKTTLSVGAEAGKPDSGYTLAVECPAGGTDMSVELQRLGQPWAGPFTVPVPAAKTATIHLARLQGEVLAEVEGKALTRLKDGQLLSGTHVCFRVPEARVDWEAGKVEGENVLDYTFARAPADWIAQSGTWAVTNRWSCSPGWSWFGGHGRRIPTIWHKREFVGDVCVSYFGGVKMDADASEPYPQRYRDMNVTICGDGVDPASGYAAIVGGWKNTKSALYRCGKLVATSDKWHFPPYGSPENPHHKWWDIRLEKIGSLVRLSVDDQAYIEYNDPDPLPGGRVALWTADNGLMVARARIYYQAESARAMDYLQCAPPPPDDTGVAEAQEKGWHTDPGDKTVVVRQEAANRKLPSICAVDMAGGGQFVVSAPGAPFDAAKGGVICFDYRVPAKAAVNLYARCNGVAYALILSGDPKPPAPAKALGALPGFVADGQWRHARYDLGAALRGVLPGTGAIPVEELFFANLTDDPYKACGFGANPAGSKYWIADWWVLGEVPNMPVVSRPPSPGGLTANPQTDLDNAAPTRGLVGVRAQFYQDQDQGAFSAANLNTPIKWATFTNPVLTKDVKRIEYNWGRQTPDPAMRQTYWSARFIGRLYVPETGDYTLYLDQLDDGGRLLIDGAVVVDSWLQQAAASHPSQPIHLARGLHNLQLDYCQADLDASLALSWSGPNLSKEIIPASSVQSVAALTTQPKR
jgi:hypothetical protein